MLDNPDDPAAFLARLSDSYRSDTINWEFILARQYSRCVPAPRTVVDVGCHEGAHAAQLLELRAERIVCFEPIPMLADRLREKFADAPAVVVHGLALGREERLASFFIDHEVPSESGLTIRQPGRRNERIDVAVRRLDSFALSNVDFIKLDCEGAEIDVLEGAPQTIAQSRPLMSIEYGASGYGAYGRSKMALYEWAVANGYIVSDLFGHALDEARTFDACVDRYYWDFFLLPRERSAELITTLREGASAIFADFATFRAGDSPHEPPERR